MPEEVGEETIAEEALDYVVQVGGGVVVEIEDNTIKLGIDKEALTKKVLSSAIYSINGVFPTADGSFFIHGSECDSWGYITGGTAYPMLEVVGDPQASGIWLTDLCPACQTCDTVYEIKQQVEQLNVLVNMIKDVELHDTATLTAYKEALESQAIESWKTVVGEDVVTQGSAEGFQTLHYEQINTATSDLPSYDVPTVLLSNVGVDTGHNVPKCSPPWTRFAAWKGRQLLQQYITVAHMWNYAVVQNNASFRLEISPEDTAGFVVQTKRSLPNCDGKWKIRCTVYVAYDHEEGDNGEVLDTKQNLSVFVPQPILRFKPFQLEEELQGTKVGGSVVQGVTAEDVALGGIDTATVIHSPDCTTKTITTQDIIARVAGTYELTVKILPFKHFVMLDSQNNVISIRNNNSGIHITGNTYYFAPTSYDEQPVQAPTKQDYLDSKTAPTNSVPFNNIWRIQIKWEIAKVETESDLELSLEEIARDDSSLPGNTVSTVAFDSLTASSDFVPVGYFKYEETKLYTCTGVREPNKNAIISDSTIPLPVTPPEPDENA